jgi:hypothetical protein
MIRYRHSYRQLPSCAKLKISRLADCCVLALTKIMKVLMLLRKRFSGVRELQYCSESMVPVERIELPTFGLQNRCSTAELNRRLVDVFNALSLSIDERFGNLGAQFVPSTGLFHSQKWTGIP